MKRKVYNECYEKVDILGKGSFGSIFKARVLDFDPEKKNKATESTNGFLYHKNFKLTHD